MTDHTINHEGFIKDWKDVPADIQRAADALNKIGKHHGWFPQSTPDDWRQLDEIGLDEFINVVEYVINSYLNKT